MPAFLAAGRSPVLYHVLAWLLCLAAFGAHAQSGPLTYTAEYEASYKGRKVGTSVFSVTTGSSADTFVYESVTTAKGLMRLMSPKPVVDRGHFAFVDGTARPLEFWHEDGSRSGEENEHITFDWDSGTATSAGAFGTRELALEPGTLDRASLQVMLMADLNNGARPTSYAVADGDTIKIYDYQLLETKTIQTALGELAVVAYAQQRQGSSRRTIIEMAPALGHVPVRIEQRRGDEILSAFELTALERD